MSKCLRCGAGNEWIEPVRSERQKPAKLRPKVRYVVYHWNESEWGVHLSGENEFIAKCSRGKDAKRIAAALNWHEARKRGEL